jgi:ribosomal protein S18 acetylase RimI-like enzyme
MQREVSGSDLRRATVADVRAIASWIRSARECELWAGPRMPFPVDVEQLPARIDFAEARTFALWSDDRLVAFGQIVPKSSRRAHLARIIVAPDARRQGHGERLIRSLIDEAHRQSHRRVSLNVDRQNDPAIALYSKLGFQEAPRPADEPDAHDSRYMELRSRRQQAVNSKQ